MATSKSPRPPQFHQQMVELVQAGRTPAQLTRDFNVSAQSISAWVARAAADKGKPARGRDLLSSAEREELVRLRRQVRQLQAKRDIPANSCVAARLVRREGRQDVHRVFELVNANRADVAVRKMCGVLRVSASGYYAWCDRSPCQRALDDAVLSERIRTIHAESDATYGMPRVRAELFDQMQRISRKHVAWLMRRAGLRGVSRRRGFVITTRRDEAQRPAPDLVKREFATHGPNQLWVADMTYVPTWAGLIFLAIVLDVWNRRIVGWAIGEQMSADLVLAALNMALQQRRRPRDVIHDSDQGSQYTSIAFGERCQKMGVRPSMGTVGDAYDNAMAESFFASLECELIDRRSWQTKTEARLALFTYIEGWYNLRRHHSALNYQSPENFERSRIETANNQRLHPIHGFPTAPLASSLIPAGGGGAVESPVSITLINP